MPASVPTASQLEPRAGSGRTARTVRFPDDLRQRLAADAERCGRSFEAQVLAILRRHFGEDVDISPSPEVILSLAVGSLAGVTGAEEEILLGRLTEYDR